LGKRSTDIIAKTHKKPHGEDQNINLFLESNMKPEKYVSSSPNNWSAKYTKTKCKCGARTSAPTKFEPQGEQAQHKMWQKEQLLTLSKNNEAQTDTNI
jgi:hypothetical protein